MKFLKLSVLALLILFITTTYSQTKIQIEKAIAVIEHLSYNEFYLGIKCYHKTEITYYEVEKRIEINEILFLGKDKNFKTKRSFYLDDIDLTSMKYDLMELPTEPGLYFVTVNIDAKGKSIEVNTVEINKDEFPLPISDLKYYDKLIFTPAGKTFPKRLAEKFVENIKILLGVESYKRAPLLKL